MKYHVSWTIEVEGASTVDAAFDAHKMMGDPTCLSTARLSVFDSSGQLEVFEFEKEVTTTQKPRHA
jgi:hypothetical protein